MMLCALQSMSFMKLETTMLTNRIYFIYISQSRLQSCLVTPYVNGLLYLPLNPVFFICFQNSCLVPFDGMVSVQNMTGNSVGSIPIGHSPLGLCDECSKLSTCFTNIYQNVLAWVAVDYTLFLGCF